MRFHSRYSAGFIFFDGFKKRVSPVAFDQYWTLASYPWSVPDYSYVAYRALTMCERIALPAHRWFRTRQRLRAKIKPSNNLVQPALFTLPFLPHELIVAVCIAFAEGDLLYVACGALCHALLENLK